MKKDLNKIFIAPVRKITSLTYETVFKPTWDIKRAVKFGKLLYWDIFYTEEIPIEVAISLTNKTKYFMNDSWFIKENDLIVDKRYAVSLIEFCINQNIEIPKNGKISSKQAQKILIKKVEQTNKTQSDNK